MTTDTKNLSPLKLFFTKSAVKILSWLPRPRAAFLCPTCALDLTRSETYKHLGVCERCGRHFSITARQRIELLADEKSFDEFEKKISSPESKIISAEKEYPKLLKQAQQETHLQEAVVTGEAEIEAQCVVLVVLDFRFMGGSMGAAVGEKIARAFERAAEENLPLVAVTATGGARIQEGMFALMQMAKTAAAAERLHQKGLPYITVLSHPTTGGVYASFANLADVIIAEPGALIGFAGPRVYEALLGRKPSNSHRAEFLFEHGMVDAIVPRADLRGMIARLLRHFSSDVSHLHRTQVQVLPGALSSDEVTLAPHASAGVSNVATEIASQTLAPPAGAGETLAMTSPPREPWEIVQLARRDDRPTTHDYIARLFSDFVELHGDRLFGDDPAIIAGIAKFDGHVVAVIGQERGHGADAEHRHRGAAEPEGYRKAWRVMRLAEKFHLPVVTFVDTPGADPSSEAEQRGVAMAIAQSIGAMTRLATQSIAIVIGEGGSGGALALAVADRVLMQENAIYSVISPEGASAILFGDASHAQEEARKLRLTARDLKSLRIIDEVVREPDAGAHTDWDAATASLRSQLSRALDDLRGRDIASVLEARYEKYREIGQGKKSPANHANHR